MNIRPTQNSNYALVRNGLALNLSKLIKAQEQVSSGKRITRPSDDPIGAASVMSLKRQLGGINRHMEAIDTSRPMLEAGMSSLSEAGTLLSEARAKAIAGLNGSLNSQDRMAMAAELRILRERLISTGNAKLGDRYLFAGTASTTQPFAESSAQGLTRVNYLGNQESRSVEIGSGVSLATNIPGGDIFNSSDSSGVSLGSLTGLSMGTTANQGSGYGYVHIRHDATVGAPGSGVTLAGAGAQDTIIGDHTLVIDGVAGTVQLGSGPVLSIPTAVDPDLSNFVVTDERGAELHLNFSAYTGTDSSVTLTGQGSISIDGSNWQAIDPLATDFELSDPTTGTILHLNTTAIRRAEVELYSFEGGVNSFDVLQGMVEDLENIHGLSSSELQDRLSSRLVELDRNFANVQSALGTLGARAQRLDSGAERLAEFEVTIQGMVSDREDADLTSVVLEMNKAQQTLEVAQASGSRLLQTTLLDYLR